MKPDIILGHASFLGHTGYANHTRNFFTHLSRVYPVRVRNYTHVDDLSYLTEEEKSILIYQKWDIPPYEVGRSFDKSGYNDILNIVLNESNHHYFYDDYGKQKKIAYNVWESTRQQTHFFEKLLEYDQLWVPTEWQKTCSIEQGYPSDKIFVVPEGIDPTIFHPIKDAHAYPLDDKFTFFLAARWEYRKSVEEIIRAFINEFKPEEPVQLILNVDNPYPTDDLKTTEARLKHHGLESSNLVVKHFMPFDEYLKTLKTCHCLVSCSRAEGWNLPLIEAIACGVPTICSDWGSQLEFAKGISHTVNIKNFQPPANMYGGVTPPGLWAEPDFEHLQQVMRDVYDNSSEYLIYARTAAKRVVKQFTWQNAVNKASEAIEKLEHKHVYKVKDSSKDLVKLNLGCGSNRMKGYINFDLRLYPESVDTVGNLLFLPFKTSSIDLIHMSHLIEHISLYKTSQALIEIHRVLKENGALTVITPDLNSCMELVKNSSDEGKIANINHIYGGQKDGGDFHLNGYTEGMLKLFIERYGFTVESIKLIADEFNAKKNIECFARKTSSPNHENTTINYHFVEGPFIEILGEDTRYYDIIITDPENNDITHRRMHPINMWTRPARKWFTNWHMRIQMGNEILFDHRLNLRNERVMISLDSKSLGDTLAWVPYVEEFRKKHRCEVILSTFWNVLFTNQYPDIEFVPPGAKIEKLYASYNIGCWDGDINKNKYDWRETPLQKIAADILGLEYVERKPNIDKPDFVREGKPIVTLSEGATAGCKQWHYPQAWQTVVNELVERGYEVWVVSKEPTDLKNIVDKTNKPITETIQNIRQSEFFMGVSSGPAWLAWALDVPVLMVSGCTHKWNEFQSDIVRIINEDVCHGCFNNSAYVFDRGDWNWCPVHRHDGEMFECTKNITPEMVIKALENKGFLKKRTKK
jgi:autotransporter strand-loop-strand O-heptosyltransferase